MSKLGKALPLAVLAFTLLAMAPFASAGGSNPSLVGTWRVQVTLVDCTTGAPVAPPFSSLLTFNAGGTMVGDTTNPGFAPGQRGDDQGLWKQKSWHVYSSRMVTFIKFTTPPDPTTHNPGFTAGQQSISQLITMKSGAKEWTSNAAVIFADSTGAVYRQGCAVADALRF